MDFVRITRGSQRYELNVTAIKGVSITETLKLFPNMPEDIVKKAHEAVNGKPRKSKKSKN